MNASSLELLEKSDLPPGQARAILQAMDTELALANLATKDDLKVLKAELRTEMASLERRLEVKIEAMGTKLVLWSFVFWVTGVGTLFSLFKWLR